MEVENIGNLKLADLPQPGQRWVIFDDLVMIVRLQTNFNFWTKKVEGWKVIWQYIDEDGNQVMKPRPTPGPRASGSNGCYLKRFLQEAWRPYYGGDERK